MSDRDYEEHVRREATSRWKWRNPFLAAVLALFLGPFGLLYVGWRKMVGAFVVGFFVVTAIRYVGWWPPPTWARYAALALLAVYAYTDARWTNAAIEYYRYGLPGTGLQKPTEKDIPRD